MYRREFRAWRASFQKRLRLCGTADPRIASSIGNAMDTTGSEQLLEQTTPRRCVRYGVLEMVWSRGGIGGLTQFFFFCVFYGEIWWV